MPSRQFQNQRRRRAAGLRIPYELAELDELERSRNSAAAIRSVFGDPLDGGALLHEMRDETPLVIVGDDEAHVADLLEEERATPGSSLRPIAALVGTAGSGVSGEIAGLADITLKVSADRAEIEGARDNLAGMAETIRILSPVYDDPAMLLLQFLYSRRAGLAPTLDADSPVAYRYPLAECVLGATTAAAVDVLDDLADHTLVTGKPLDRLFLCPDCNGYRVLVKELCTQCHSPNIAMEDSIHHFRCGYVGPEKEFIASGHGKCPKCEAPLRHIGVEYNRPGRIVNCEQCGHWGADPELRAWCVDCNRYHAPEQLKTVHIRGYTLTPDGSQAARNGRWGHYQAHVLRPDGDASVPLQAASGEKQEAMRLLLSIALENHWPVVVYKIDVFAQSGERLSAPDGHGLLVRTEDALREILAKKDLIARVDHDSFFVVATKNQRHHPVQVADLEHRLSKQLPLRVRVTELIPSAALNLLSTGA